MIALQLVDQEAAVAAGWPPGRENSPSSIRSDSSDVDAQLARIPGAIEDVSAGRIAIFPEGP